MRRKWAVGAAATSLAEHDGNLPPLDLLLHSAAGEVTDRYKGINVGPPAPRDLNLGQRASSNSKPQGGAIQAAVW